MSTLHCALCGGALRPVSVTSEGSVEQCPCGRTSITRLVKGSLVVTPQEKPER